MLGRRPNDHRDLANYRDLAGPRIPEARRRSFWSVAGTAIATTVAGTCAVGIAANVIDHEYKYHQAVSVCAIAPLPGGAYDASRVRAEALRRGMTWRAGLRDAGNEPGVVRDEASAAYGFGRFICQVRHRNGWVVSADVVRWGN